MAASHENPWWMDVLEHGPASPYAGYFDIDWHPATSKAAFLQENKILLPVLGNLYVTDAALDFRRANSEVYLEGGYMPLEASGPHRENLCAFARHIEGHWCLTAVPRWSTRLAPKRGGPLRIAAWQGTCLQLPAEAPDTWRNVLTGETVATAANGEFKQLEVAQVLNRFPVALLDSVS